MQPEGFVSCKHWTHVCHFLKSFYSLKQALYTWNQTINVHLVTYSFLPTKADPCIYIYKRNNQVSIISLYVDDYTIIISPSFINEKFKMKDLNEASSILSIKILHNKHQDTLELH